jgi:hypothetical protein
VDIRAPPLDELPIGTIDSQVGQAVGILVSGAQDVPYGEARESTRQSSGLLMEWNQILMLDPIFAQHLIDEEQGVGDHHELVGSFRHRQLHGLQQAGVLRDVIRRSTQIAAGFDDLAAVEREERPVAGGARVPAGGAIDERSDLQDATLSP